MPPFAHRHQHGRTKTDHYGEVKSTICSGFNYLMGRAQRRQPLFSEGQRDSTGGNTHKVEDGKFPLDMRKVFHSDAGQMVDQGPERL